MAKKAKRGFARILGVVFVMLLSAACVGYYVILGEVEISFAQKPSAVDAQEAARKINLLTEAQAAKKNGFIRLSEAEINSLLQKGAAKLDKNRTNAPVHLVKAGVLLDEKEIIFVTWHNISIFGMEFPLVWQRALSPERSANGWSLALQDMRVGKLRIPRSLWHEPSRLLGGADTAFEEPKAWLATLPTLMLSKNEVSQKPEVRLYTYIPVVKENADAVSLPRVEAPKTGATNTLTANL